MMVLIVCDVAPILERQFSSCNTTLPPPSPLRAWDENIHTSMYKTDNQQGHTM